MKARATGEESDIISSLILLVYSHEQNIGKNMNIKRVLVRAQKEMRKNVIGNCKKDNYFIQSQIMWLNFILTCVESRTCK